MEIFTSTETIVVYLRYFRLRLFDQKRIYILRDIEGL